MKKKLIVAAIAAAVVAPTLAMADATVYGKVRVATQYHDRDQNFFRDAEGDLHFGPEDSWGMQDQTSRLGIKGSEDLGNGLKAIYKMEFGVNVGDGWGKDKNTFWSQRNSYVGLAGGWGTFLVGRHDTPYKMSSGKLDFFADTAADYDAGKNVGVPTAKSVSLFNSIRADGLMAYISPNWAGFTLSAALIQTDTSGFDDRGLPNQDADDFASAYSIAGQYSNGPWFASLAYEDLDGESLGERLNTGPFTDNYTKWRAGLGILGWAGFSGAFIYEDRSNQDFRDGNDSSSWQLQGAYDFGNNRVKGMYGSYDSDDFADFHDGTAWAIGYQYNFSSRTDVQVLYRDYDGDDDDISLIGDDKVFAVQLDHSF
jgi:predicted porin